MTPTARTAAGPDTRNTRMTAETTSTSLPRAAGRVGATILMLACGFHAYWAAGGEWGAATAFGSPELPPQAASAAVAIVIAGAALLLLASVGILGTPLPNAMPRVGNRALVAVFALVGVNNLIQAPDAYARDWHIYFFGPLLLALAALCAVAERSRPPR